MSELYESCVVLKNLPPTCDEPTVREVLDLAHGDFRFQDKYEKLHRHVEFGNDIRWIVLFKSKRDAIDCIKSGTWETSCVKGGCHVTPDYCSGCIIPDEWTENISEDEEDDGDWDMARSLYSPDYASGTSGDLIHSFVKVTSNKDLRCDDHTDSEEDYETKTEDVNVPKFGNELDETKFVKYYNDFETLISDINSSSSLFDSGNPKRAFNTSFEREDKEDYYKNCKTTYNTWDSQQLSGERMPSSDLFGSGRAKVTEEEHKDKLTSDKIEPCSGTVVPDTSTEEINDGDKGNGPQSGELFGSGGGRENINNEKPSKIPRSSEMKTELRSSNEEEDDDVYRVSSVSSSELFDSGSRRNKPSRISSDEVYGNDYEKVSHRDKERKDIGKGFPENETLDIMTEKVDLENTQSRNKRLVERNLKKSMSASVRSADLFGDGPESQESMEFQYKKDNNGFDEEVAKRVDEDEGDSKVETANTNARLEGTPEAKCNSTDNNSDQGASSAGQGASSAGQGASSVYQGGQYLYTGLPYQNPQVTPSMNYATYMPMAPPGQRLPSLPSQEVSNMGYHMNPMYQMPFPLQLPVQVDEKGQPLHQFMPFAGMMPPVQLDEKGQPIYQQMQPGMMMPQVYYIPYIPGQPPFIPASQQSNESKVQVKRDDTSSSQTSNTDTREPEKLENALDMTDSYIYDNMEQTPGYLSPRRPISTPGYSFAKEVPEPAVSRNTTAGRQSDDNLKHMHLSGSRAGEELDENIYEEIDSSMVKSVKGNSSGSEVGTAAMPRPPPPPNSRPPLKKRDTPHPKKQLVPIFDDDDSESSEKDKKEDEEGNCRTILVKGLFTDISRDALELYFENKRKTGGGEIVNATINEKKLEALIEFKNTEDAAEVVRRARSGENFSISGCQLSVFEYVPPPIDRLKVFIRDIAETTTIDCVTNFLAASIKSEPLSVVFGETPGTAMAYFDTPPDISELRKYCDRRKCEGNRWKIFDVELSRSVKVTGLSSQTTPESLSLYFENKRRSQGGDVETAKYREERGDFIVTFVNAEDAERVSQAKHKLGGQEPRVALFYPCLEIDEDFIVRIPQPILLDGLDEYIPKFLVNSKKYKAEFENKIQTSHGSIVWPSAEQKVIQINCTVDPKDNKGHTKVKNWTETCSSIAKQITDELTVEKSSNVAVEVWPELKSHLQGIEVPDPESIAVFLESSVCVIVMVGETMDVRSMSKQIRDITNDLEKKMDSERQIITKKRKLKHFEMALVRASKLESALKKTLTEFIIDNEQREIVCKGMQKDVDDAFGKIDSKLRSFVKRTVPEMSKQAIDLLFKREARDIIKKKMIEKKVTGVWDPVKGTGLIMYSKNEKELDVAIEILRSSVIMDSFALDEGKREILESNAGKAKIREFEENHQGCLIFTILSDELRFVCLDNIRNEIKDEFTKLFDLHSIISTRVPAEPGIFNYIVTYEKREIENIESQYKRLSVLIEVKDTTRRPGFIVKGKKDGCKLAIAKLQKMIDSVVHKDHTVSWPGFDKFLQSSEGRDSIKSIEMIEKCVIKVSSDVLSSGLESTHRKKQVSPERTEKRGRIRKEVIIGSLTSEKVDVIVNSTNKDLDLTVGAVSRNLLKAGGTELDQECKTKYPDGIKSGEVAVTSGGMMKCKQLYHGLLTKWDGGQGHAERVMENFVKCCLSLAHTNKHSSIAFPALGTGAMGFPADVVAETMFGIVDAFEAKHPDTSLRTVRFVIWSEDKVTVRAFQDVESRAVGVSSRSSSTRQSYRYSEASENMIVKNKGYSTTIGPVSVCFVKDDLTLLTSGAIVNSTMDDLNLNSGAISKAILAAAGPSIQTEATARKSKFMTDGLVVTNPGNLLCQYIIHVRARNSLSGWAETIKKSLIVAERLGLNSIAFPALGTGGKGVSPDRMAKTMMETFKDYIQSSDFQRCLKTIRVVIFEEKMLGLFIDEIKGTLDPEKPGRWRSLLPDFKLFDKKPAAEAPISSVTIHIYGGSRYSVDSVVTKVGEIRKEKDVFVPKIVLDNMDESQKSELRRVGYSTGVKVVVEKSRVKVMGYGKSADIALRKVEECIKSMENDIRKGVASSALKLPSSWTKMKLTDPAKIVMLMAGDPDYVSVSRKFLQETGYLSTCIVKIERIQNPTLFTQYSGKKKQMEIHNSGGRNVEQMLWHGTKSTAVDNIKNKGFDRNYNSGSSHGVGVYFAKQAATSARGYCSPDANGHKHIFLAHVLTGEYCVGQGGIRVPPTKSISPYATYDSTTDNVRAPNFFVIFHDAQAYPSFLVTFT